MFARVLIALFVFGLAASTTATQVTYRASVNSAGIESNAGGSAPGLTADGRWVIFTSQGTFLVPNDTNNVRDVFVHDLWTGTTERASVAPLGVQGNADSDGGALSPGGLIVAFWSDASNLVTSDTNGASDVFVHVMSDSTNERVSVSSTGQQGDGASTLPAINSDARFVAFQSQATNLVAGDTNGFLDIFVRDRFAGTTERVSIDTAGTQGLGGHSFSPALSADGRYIAFSSAATNLVATDTNGDEDIFVRDRQAGTTTRVSVGSFGAQANSSSRGPSLSEDGRFVAFGSAASNLVPADAGGWDVFVRDLQLGTNELVSVSTAGVQSNGRCDRCRISADGSYAVFDSDADNLDTGDTPEGWSDVFLRDRNAGTTELVSRALSGLSGNWTSGEETLGVSGDGTVVVYSSDASDIVPGDTAIGDIVVRDTGSGCQPISIYCTPKQNSANCVPVISANSVASLAGPDAFFVTAVKVLNQKSGIFFWGSAPASLPFGGGTLCVKAPTVRTPVQFSGGPGGAPNCGGTYSFHFEQSYMAAQGLVAGEAVYGQYWSRDPGFAPPNNIGLTDAVLFFVCP